MTDTTSSGKAIAADEPRPAGADAGVWQRLRKQMERIRTAETGRLDPAALAGKLAERARVLRGRIERSEAPGEQLSFLAFNKGGRRYGIAISEIVEVQPFEQYTPVPGAPPFIPGVIHWRGAIISLLDLGQLAGIRESGLVDVRAFVLVESAGRRLGVLAGEVDELYSVPLEELKSPPELAAHVPPEWIVGVHDENRLVLRMDVILRDPRLGAGRRAGLDRNLAKCSSS